MKGKKEKHLKIKRNKWILKNTSRFNIAQKSTKNSWEDLQKTSEWLIKEILEA